VSSIPAGVRPPTLRLEGGTSPSTPAATPAAAPTPWLGDAITFGPDRHDADGVRRSRWPAGRDGRARRADGTATFAIDGPVLTLMNGTNGLQLRADRRRGNGHDHDSTDDRV
jgi:hypothetical protein